MEKEKLNKIDESNLSKKPKKNKLLVIIIIIGILVFVTFATFKIVGGNRQYDSQEQQQKETKKEIEKVVVQAGRLFVLPEGETPVLATVVDAESLKAEQPFYANVVEGDKVLVYLQNQQAVIYSPSRDMIVNVGPVVVND